MFMKLPHKGGKKPKSLSLGKCDITAVLSTRSVPRATLRVTSLLHIPELNLRRTLRILIILVHRICVHISAYIYKSDLGNSCQSDQSLCAFKFSGWYHSLAQAL